MNAINISCDGERGKYDEECEEVFRETQAEGVLLIVANGKRGSGFSAFIKAELAAEIPNALRQVADEIESDMKKAIQN